MPSDREPSQSAGPHAPARAIGEHPAARGVAPVHAIPGDDGAPAPEGDRAVPVRRRLRAMLFHLGGIRRLNEARLARRLRASRAFRRLDHRRRARPAWKQLDFGRTAAGRLGRAGHRADRALAGHTIDVRAVARGCYTPASVGERVAAAYREHLYGDATLQDAARRRRGAAVRHQRDQPASPACSFASRARTAPTARRHDPRPRQRRWPTRSPPPRRSRRCCRRSSSTCGSPLADRGAATTCTEPPYRGELALTDGGVYDNLGLETVWKRTSTVLVSDGGGHARQRPGPARGLAAQHACASWR